MKNQWNVNRNKQGYIPSITGKPRIKLKNTAMETNNKIKNTVSFYNNSEDSRNKRYLNLD